MIIINNILKKQRQRRSSSSIHPYSQKKFNILPGKFEIFIGNSHSQHTLPRYVTIIYRNVQLNYEKRPRAATTHK